MKICLLFLLFSSSLYAKNWIVKTPNSFLKNNCTYTLLNPHFGGDIYKAECPDYLNFLEAEESRVWKILSFPWDFFRPNDLRFGDQWGLDMINVRSYWKYISTGDPRIKVAIIDTGINYLHPDLQNNLAINYKEIPNNGIDDDGNGYVDDYLGWNAADNNGDPMDNFNHGTHIAGIIGASTNNGIGMAGINWHVSLIPIKFITAAGGGSTEASIKGIDYAIARGAKIINASWGGSDTSPLLQEVINRCRSLGVLFIAAAGNRGMDNDKNPMFPASFPIDNIISVAAIDSNKNLSSFSDWGLSTVHVAAPGEHILSTIGANNYDFLDGTSMAVPFISGAAALIWSAHPSWTYLDIKNYIIGHCIVDQAHPLPVKCQGYF